MSLLPFLSFHRLTGGFIERLEKRKSELYQQIKEVNDNHQAQAQIPKTTS